MKITSTLAAIMTLTAGVGEAWADSVPKTISEALRRPVYAKAYTRMMLTGGPIQPWFSSAGAAMRAKDQSSSMADVEGVPMQVLVFCEPTSCSSGSFAVIFLQDGRRAIGASDVKGAVQVFGGPTIFEVDHLTSAFLP